MTTTRHDAQGSAPVLATRLDTTGAEAMAELMKLFPEQQDLIVNRALGAYARIHRAQQAGGGAWMQSDKESPPIKEHID